MTGDTRWYVLDTNEGELVAAGGGEVGVHTFFGPLSTRDGETLFSLRLWLAPEHPLEMSETARARARENCLLAVGWADELTIGLRGDSRYQVSHGALHGALRTLRFNLGHEVTVRADEVFDAKRAAALFLAYYQTGTVPTSEYRLRELTSPDVLTGQDNATHALTINYDKQRPVLPTVESGAFSAFIYAAGEDASTVLVLWPLPSGKKLAELTDEERSTHEEFMQAAGSSGDYTVEVRKKVGDGYKLYTVGHQVDYLVWDTANDVEIFVGNDVLTVYPNEVFTPDEVDALFLHYARTGQLPEDGYLLGEYE
jgi:hypothetical protein